MDIRFISPGILRHVAGKPELAVRLERTGDGEPGDGMLLLCGRTLHLVERARGQFDYRTRQAGLDGMQLVASDDASATLEGEAGRWVCRWSILDGADAAKLLQTLGGVEKDDVAVSWAALFAAGLLYAAAADVESAKDQEPLIREFVSPAAFRSGAALRAASPLGEFTRLIREKCNTEQKLSLLANQLELMMSDGMFRRSERAFAAEFAAGIGVGSDVFNSLERFMILKNQYSALFSAEVAIQK